jgi:choline-sulfatase
MNFLLLKLVSLRIGWSLAVLVALSVAELSAAEPRRLNLISIVTDDQAAWSIGAYGNRESRTPNMDRLAREGARFLNAFASTPVCSPSRATFLTGRYGTQVGVTDWITPKQAQAGLGLPSDSVTWPKVLQQQGYKTGLIGKWHLGSQPQFHPTRLGFDSFMGAPAGSFRPKDPELEVNGQLTKIEGFGADILTDAALRFIESNRAGPFALLIHFREPHMPYDPVPEADSAPFKELDPTVPPGLGTNTTQVKQWTRLYYGAVHSVDRNLGRLLARLDELRLSENTIVMLTSDHGYMIGHHGLHAKGNGYRIGRARGSTPRQTRPNMFEESIRIPLIVRWPGVIKPGLEIPKPVSNLDTYATVLSMLGAKPPQNWKQEGVDLTPLLRGKRDTPHAEIYAQYDLQNDAVDFMRMIRTDEWKLVRHYFSDGADELYHLRDDPGETQNLYNDPRHTRTLAELQKKLLRWQRAIADPILRRLEPK